MLPGEEDILLAECLSCGYSLKGLPAEHVCPECGKAFDRRRRDFGGRTRRRKGSLWRRLVILDVILLVGLVATCYLFRLPMWVAFIVVAVNMLVDAVLFIAQATGPVISVGPDGVSVLGRWGRRRKHFKWERIRGAELGSLLLVGRNKPVDLPLCSEREALEYVRHINAYVRLMRSGRKDNN